MLHALANDVAAIAFARSLPELKNAFTASLNRLGFISYNIGVNQSSLLDFMEKPTFTTWTTEDLDEYVNDRWLERDPLVKHLDASKTPLLWHRENFNTAAYRDYYEYIRIKGITSGLTLPLPAISGKASAITLISIDDTRKSPEIISAVMILSNVAMARIASFKDGQFYDFDIRRFNTLSNLQIEILSWVAKGKTNSEIAIIVERTERVVAYHISEILNKIGVTSRVQAAAFYAVMGY